MVNVIDINDMSLLIPDPPVAAAEPAPAGAPPVAAPEPAPAVAPPVAVAAPAPAAQDVRKEPVSPFVEWSPEERGTIAEPLLQNDESTSMIVDLLRSPRAIVERLLDPERTESLVLGSAGLLSVATSAFTLTMLAARDVSLLSIAPLLATGSALMATAASLGPIYAASLLLAARLPMARLAATALAAVATGSLILAGLAPVVYVLFRLDDTWAGPLGLVSAFLLSAAAGGARMRRLLHDMADAVHSASTGDARAKLGDEDVFRVGVLARIALMMLGFSWSLAVWALDAFV